MYKSILENAFPSIPLNSERHSFFYNCWEEVAFKKGDLVTQAGNTENYFYIVLEGIQAIYILTPKGDKKVIGFSFTGSFSGVYDSFLKTSASHYFLETLTESRLIRMSKESYDRLFELYPEFNEWGRIAHQELLIGRVQREVELITMTAKERFEVFMSRCPKALLDIPQKYLASYLNMTPETFSRMRATIS